MGEKGASKGVMFFLVMVILGALLGGVLGEILGLIIKEGTLNKILVTGLNVSWGPAPLNLAVLQFTFGLGMKLNLLSVFGIIGAMWLFYKL